MKIRVDVLGTRHKSSRLDYDLSVTLERIQKDTQEPWKARFKCQKSIAFPTTGYAYKYTLLLRTQYVEPIPQVIGCESETKAFEIFK